MENFLLIVVGDLAFKMDQNNHYIVQWSAMRMVNGQTQSWILASTIQIQHCAHTHTVEYYINTSCVFCQKTIEFIPHLFFVCPISHTLWCKVLQVLKICKPSLCWRREVSWFCKKANLVNPCCVESRTSLSLLVLIIFGYIAINQAVFQH